MSDQNLPKIGDVIKSEKFQYGFFRTDEAKELRKVVITGLPGDHKQTSYVKEEERVSVAARTGEVPPKTVTVDFSADDPSRAAAEFVVESAYRGPNMTAHGPGDVYYGVWCVAARRLNPDGTYDPSGELACFEMTGDSTRGLKTEDLHIVGKMARSVQFTRVS